MSSQEPDLVVGCNIVILLKTMDEMIRAGETLNSHLVQYAKYLLLLYRPCHWFSENSMQLSISALTDCNLYRPFKHVTKIIELLDYVSNTLKF